MCSRSLPKEGEIWKHFKGHKVKIVGTAMHTETGESMVVYFCREQLWVRPLDVFMSEVDKEKYPAVEQVYRFVRSDIC